MKPPTVSVILPIHNAQEYLNMSIDSLMLQTYKDFELIVVDCGSNDNSRSIVANYQNPQIKLAEQKSESIKNGLGLGISKARGKYIALFSQDDICDPNRLKKQVMYLQENENIQLAGTNFDLIDNDSRLFDVNEKKLKFIRQNSFSAGSAMFSSALNQDIIAGRLDLDKWWGNLHDYNIGLVPEALYYRRLTDLKLNTGKSDSFYTWLSLAGAISNETKPPADFKYKGEPTNADKDNLERLIKFCDNTWENNELTTAQKKLLEDLTDKLQEELSIILNKLNGPPAVSVVMSVYNTEQYLHEAASSILKQTFKDFEFIIIDDGSSDRSMEIARSLKDKRIRIVHQLNHGLVYSFNKGVKLARAEYIARMDADDFALPTRFAKEVSWLEADSNRGFVGTFFQYMDSQTSKRTKVIMIAPTKHLDVLRMMYLVNPIGHGSVMMRKTAVDSVGGYRSKYEPAEDYDLWQRIARKWEIGVLPEILYLWRLHPGSISRRKEDQSNAAAAMTVKNMWAGPAVYKSVFQIVRDAKYYRSLDSKLSNDVYELYLSQQTHLGKEFLIHQKLYAGWHTALGSILLRPNTTKELWKTMAATTRNRIRGAR